MLLRVGLIDNAHCPGVEAPRQLDNAVSREGVSRLKARVREERRLLAVTRRLSNKPYERSERHRAMTGSRQGGHYKVLPPPHLLLLLAVPRRLHRRNVPSGAAYPLL